MYSRFFFLLLGMLASFGVAAQGGIDTTAAVATIGDGNAAVATIGAVILALAAVVAVYKWVTRSAR